MPNDCTTSCLVTAPAFSVVAGCGLQNNTRSGYIKGFVAVRCDSPITDVTSTAEWTALLSAGKAFYAPPGTGVMPEAATSDEITENCEPPVPMRQTYTFGYESYRVDTTGLTDDVAWNTIKTSVGTWRIAPITCDNIILTRQDFATGKVPGFKMGGTISTKYDNSAAMSYVASLTFDYDQLIHHVQLTDDVVDVFEAWLNGTIT